jgi:hypothetical protein
VTGGILALRDIIFQFAALAAGEWPTILHNTDCLDFNRRQIVNVKKLSHCSIMIIFRSSAKTPAKMSIGRRGPSQVFSRQAKRLAADRRAVMPPRSAPAALAGPQRPT